MDHGLVREGGAVPDGIYLGYGPPSLQECVHQGP